jgi:putative transposase
VLYQGKNAWQCARAASMDPNRADVHHGTAAAVRADVLTAAYRQHPERFVRSPPTPPRLPATAWINPPDESEAATQ